MQERYKEKILDSEEDSVYIEQRRFRNMERSQYRKDSRNGKILYSSWDSESMTGEELLPDRSSDTVEDVVEKAVLCEQVRMAVTNLCEEQRQLVSSIFFEGKTEKELAKELGISQQGVSKRVRLALAEIKKFMKF